MANQFGPYVHNTFGCMFRDSEAERRIARANCNGSCYDCEVKGHIKLVCRILLLTEASSYDLMLSLHGCATD